VRWGNAERIFVTTGFATLKALDRPLTSINTDEEDYLDGRVKSNTKFDHFYKVEYVLFTK